MLIHKDLIREHLHITQDNLVNIRSETLCVSWNLAEVNQLIQDRMKLPIVSHQNTQTEARQTHILTEPPQLTVMLTTNAYTSDIILLRIILDELCKAHELVLILFLHISQITFIHHFFSRLNR